MMPNVIKYSSRNWTLDPCLLGPELGLGQGENGRGGAAGGRQAGPKRVGHIFSFSFFLICKFILRTSDEQERFLFLISV
jgi:hypothetical protein